MIDPNQIARGIACKWQVKYGICEGIPDLEEAIAAALRARDAWKLKAPPSIDRIDPTKGYIRGNCQWLTQQQNSRRSRGAFPKGYMSPNLKRRDKRGLFLPGLQRGQEGSK